MLRNEAKKYAQNLTYSSKRKLSLALALIGNPSILFLDEPTFGLDELSK